jgi:uncharacterized integral membrane protein
VSDADNMTGEHRRYFGKTIPQLVVWAALAIILTLFIAENRAEVSVRFLIWTVQTSLVWALLLAAVLGYLLGIFRISITRRR